MVKLPKSFWLIAPFATWMVLMTALPATAEWYAWRTVIVGSVLLFAGRQMNKLRFSIPWKETGLGIAVGLVVFVLWIAPEQFDWAWYRKWCVIGEGGTQAVAEASAVMIAIRLLGSAFVISIAEELFFRKWLVEFAGFGWMLVLFGVEHMRWDLGVARGSVFIAEGVFAGLCYGLLAKKYGIVSAIVAHAVTNFVLGLYVIGWDKWFYW